MASRSANRLRRGAGKRSRWSPIAVGSPIAAAACIGFITNLRMLGTTSMLTSRQNNDWLKPDIAQLRIDGNPRLDLLSLEPGRSNRVPTELAIHGELVLAHVNSAGQVLYFNHPDAVRADDDDVAFNLPRPAIDRDRQVRVKLKFVRELVPKPAKNSPFAVIDGARISRGHYYPSHEDETPSALLMSDAEHSMPLNLSVPCAQPQSVGVAGLHRSAHRPLLVEELRRFGRDAHRVVEDRQEMNESPLKVQRCGRMSSSGRLLPFRAFIR